MTQRVREPNIWKHTRHIGHTREDMTGINGQRCTPPADFVFDVDLRIKSCRILGTAPVLPGEGGKQRVALVINKHMGVDLRTQADGCDGAVIK